MPAGQAEGPDGPHRREGGSGGQRRAGAMPRGGEGRQLDAKREDICGGVGVRTTTVLQGSEGEGV
eukprot:2875847-Prorocentrum_lima.AAC.1